MNRKIVLSLALVSLLGLSACNNYSSPQGILGSAYKAVEKNKLKSFRKTLTGEALVRFGNQDGINVIKQTLLAYSNVTVANVFLTDVRKDSQGRDSLRLYTADVVGKINARDAFQTIFRTDIPCQVRYVRVRDNIDTGYDCYGNHCHGHPMPPMYHTEEQVTCHIDSIQVR